MSKYQCRTVTQQSPIDHVSRTFQHLICQELGVCFKEEQLVRKAAPMTLSVAVKKHMAVVRPTERPRR